MSVSSPVGVPVSTSSERRRSPSGSMLPVTIVRSSRNPARPLTTGDTAWPVARSTTWLVIESTGPATRTRREPSGLTPGGRMPVRPVGSRAIRERSSASRPSRATSADPPDPTTNAVRPSGLSASEWSNPRSGSRRSPDTDPFGPLSLQTMLAPSSSATREPPPGAPLVARRGPDPVSTDVSGEPAVTGSVSSGGADGTSGLVAEAASPTIPTVGSVAGRSARASTSEPTARTRSSPRKARPHPVPAVVTGADATPAASHSYAVAPAITASRPSSATASDESSSRTAGSAGRTLRTSGADPGRSRR